MSDPTMDRTFHVAMFPWLAIGHMTPFLHLGNNLAARGHRVSFYLPKKALSLLQDHNSHPDLITFHVFKVPHVDGLPPGTETASDIPISDTSLLVAAMDRTRDQFESSLLETRPDFVFYDVAHWVPMVARPLGIKAICYKVVAASSIAIALVPARKVVPGMLLTEKELAEVPPGYPSRTVVLHGGEARSLQFVSMPFGEGITFYERTTAAMRESDALAIRTCRELEGNFCNYISEQYGKPVFLTGPVLPFPSTSETSEEQWISRLSQFETGSVIFCAFGSQYILEIDQFQELLLGIEATERPFLVSLKPPNGAASVEEAFPPGFGERTKGRGTVTGGWVPQPQILRHKSVGCFVSHCGFGSMWESLMCESQLVLVPHLGDQILNARLLAEELRVAVEVDRTEHGLFSKESMRKAIESVMDPDGEVGKTVRKNHARWRETLTATNFMSDYVDEFVRNLRSILRPHA
ncbi:hypothetical protein MLD38_027089 [Melastoma candidum]|uniref:Uncharacterized protein n=1 Tax=Melastoma candidum TaxID=119954 RepID=A0ACB9P0M8_9MYRT|nr:hypothetical protein MLD38_027089 [Melastoma candidum]